MTVNAQVVGRTKTVLVFASEKAVISEIVAHSTEQRARKRRLCFRGTVKFKDSVKRHIRQLIVPIADNLTDALGLPRRIYELSVVNLGVASTADVGVDISGFSADVSILVSVLSSALQVAMSNDFVSTGHIASVEGDIRAVKGIPAKVDAAIEDASVHRFIYSDLEKDTSLKALSPGQRNRSINAVLAAQHSIRSIAVRGVDDLIQEIITEEQETIQELITLVTKAQAEPSALAMRDECNSTLTGVYFPAASYCVYVGGRNMEQINKTEYHEACHALIKEDKKHFCK